MDSANGDKITIIKHRRITNWQKCYIRQSLSIRKGQLLENGNKMQVFKAD